MALEALENNKKISNRKSNKIAVCTERLFVLGGKECHIIAGEGDDPHKAEVREEDKVLMRMTLPAVDEEKYPEWPRALAAFAGYCFIDGDPAEKIAKLMKPGFSGRMEKALGEDDKRTTWWDVVTEKGGTPDYIGRNTRRGEELPKGKVQVQKKAAGTITFEVFE